MFAPQQQYAYAITTQMQLPRCNSMPALHVQQTMHFDASAVTQTVCAQLQLTNCYLVMQLQACAEPDH